MQIGISVHDTHVVNTVRTILPEVTDQQVVLLLCDLWQNGIDSVHDMRVVNTYAKSHMIKDLEKCLQEA